MIVAAAAEAAGGTHMDFHDSPADAAFRAEVRSFIDVELPDELAHIEPEWGTFNTRRARGIDAGAMRRWREKLAAKRWIAPHWPQQYGGAGMDIGQQFIFNEEMALRRAPGVGGIGTGWAGPTIMVYGTEEQKQRFLPRILSGQETWCQGFSEPGSGSDLASLQTRALRDGDDYVVNGQKIWTSGAHHSQWMILLARTDPDAPKHKGISYFLLEMKTPGITMQPLVNMLDDHSFNQVFFDNVRVPKENLLGEENRGWYIGATTLDFERSSIAASTSLLLIVRDLTNWVRASGRSLTAAQRAELAERTVEAEIGRLLSYQVISMQKRGLIPNKEASVAKLYNGELDQRIALTGMHICGMEGNIVAPEERRAPLLGRIPRHYMAASATTIGGGTSEIQRGIIATRGLGLPRG
jgi:alkylation response protein AidB-like acyl-CoA dehydrogenase